MTVIYKNIQDMLIVYNKNKSNYKFIIDWTPKAGCTVICKIFFDYMDELNKALNYSSWIHDYREKYYYANYGRVNNNQLLSNNFIKIKFVRNPYSRAVSSYIHVMKTRLKKLFNNEDMSFYTFLLYLKQKKYPNNSHYCLQNIDLEKNNNIFNHIIKIENLEEEINNLNKLYNLNLNYDYTSTHHIKKINKKIDVSDVKFSQITEIPNYNNFYSKKTKDLVDEIYKPDIIRYNYTFDEFLKSNM